MHPSNAVNYHGTVIRKRQPLPGPVFQSVQEVDQAGEIHHLVVVHGHVAAGRAVQVTPRGRRPAIISMNAGSMV
jgi:hypothetical protein